MASNMLTGYRLMWMVVMFDLPVVERAERKAATEFRNALRREFGVDERVSNEVFRQWDTDRSGTLEYGELARAMNKSVRQDANKVAHAVDSIRDRKSRSVHAIQNKFLSSVARGNQDVSPHERYIAQTILSTRSHRNRKKRRNSFSHHRRRRRR